MNFTTPSALQQAKHHKLKSSESWFRRTRLSSVNQGTNTPLQRQARSGVLPYSLKAESALHNYGILETGSQRHK